MWIILLTIFNLLVAICLLVLLVHILHIRKDIKLINYNLYTIRSNIDSLYKLSLDTKMLIISGNKYTCDICGYKMGENDGE